MSGWWRRQPLYMLPRIEIAWGQPEVSIPVSECGKYIGIEIYDRPEGGEPLSAGQWWPDKPYILAMPEDSFLLSLKW